MECIDKLGFKISHVLYTMANFIYLSNIYALGKLTFKIILKIHFS